MQLIKTKRDRLLRPLQIVSGIVERRHTLPILANLLMTKQMTEQGPRLSFLSTDLELQISTHTDLIVDDSAAAADASQKITTTVAARKLLDILRAIPEGDVSLSLPDADQRLTIQSEKSRFTLQTLPAKEFPTVTVAQDFSVHLSVSQKDFRQLLGMTYFAMAQQDIRYYLNGMLLVVDGDQMTVVATDGHRLALASMSVDGSFARQEIIIPRKTILELQRLLEDVDEPLLIDIASNQIKLTFSEVELISKRVEGKFPDFQRVIPKGHPNTFVIKRDQLQKALARAAILTSDKFKGIHCLFEPGRLKLISTNSAQEEAHEELDISYAGPVVDIGFNITYLLDVTHLKVDALQLNFSDSTSSVLFTVPDDDRFKYVVMPMRI